ncbi:MAG: AAA family ATPase [Clostridia bacterium]|nr:AAA family ATPase [Clostridia bacterium]
MEDPNKKDSDRIQDKFLKNMYDDLYSLLQETQRSIDSQKLDLNSIPKIEIPTQDKQKLEKEINDAQNEKMPEEPKAIAVEAGTKIKELNKKVDNCNLTEESKLVLKKMLEYAKKYNSGVVKNYIPFNMRIYCDNDSTLYEIVNILADGFEYFKYTKSKEAAERSFYVIEDASHITDMYTGETSLVIFKDVDGLLNKDKQTKDKLLKIWENDILKHSNPKGFTTIVVDKNKDKINELFINNATLRDRIFDFELQTTPPVNQEIFKLILDKFRKDYVVTGAFEIKLLDFVNETYKKSTLSAPEYVETTAEKILFNQTGEVIDENTIPEFEKNKSIEEIFKDLNELVGLDNVKTMLKDLVSLMEFRKKTDKELKIKDTNLHMVFLGNPGTGKTTVARMVANILYNLGYIDQNKLIEVSAKDLVGQYVGQTAPKTMSVIEKALGGVLFIDEAYSLATKPGSSTTFNEECVATLIQAMENYRDNLVVIFAGYKKEMDGFLRSNSGIVSRIGYTMDFKDYTTDELIQIFRSMFEKAGFILDDSAIEKVREIIEKFRDTEGFGNARFVRNLYEKAIIEHATNTAEETDKTILKTITKDDITAENIGKLN